MTSVEAFFHSEPGYVVVLFALFVIPKVLQRWRLPSAVTSFVLGGIGALGFGLFTHDATIHLLATFGIVAIFLFAGLEVDVSELQPEGPVLLQHLAVRIALLALVTWLGMQLFGLSERAAVLVALATLTPSTGFILDSLDRFGLSQEERFWVKSKAIATEILALLVLFVTLQSTTAIRLVLAILALAAVVAILPRIFRLFAERVVPYAPKSEFAFLLMMALLAAYATRQLGVYYLVGAFLVGMAARRFRESLPAMASERMLHAVEVFASFFAPFYFFAAGSELTRSEFTLPALAIGLGLLVTMVPLRLASVVLHRGLAMGESRERSFRVAVPMSPTLVFTLVLAGILREEFGVSDAIFGGLVIYTILNTLIPGFFFGAPTPAYDAPELPAPTSEFVALAIREASPDHPAPTDRGDLTNDAH